MRKDRINYYPVNEKHDGVSGEEIVGYYDKLCGWIDRAVGDETEKSDETRRLMYAVAAELAILKRSVDTTSEEC